MAYAAKVVADSISESGSRLTTLEVTFPRMVLAEFNTHRDFSRNSASSRAIPVAKQLERIKSDPYIPIHWGANQSGMQAYTELDEEKRAEALKLWLSARDAAVSHVEQLMAIGLHKQITNRLLEPFMWHTVIVTATKWRNFWGLRANPDAQPEIRKAAELMRAAYDNSTPRLVKDGEWHLPYIQQDEMEWARNNIDLAIKVSVGRCARVSYLTHDGTRDHEKDIELYDRLVGSGHMSPLEHVATPMKKGLNALAALDSQRRLQGNFEGWEQHRKTVPNEADFSRVG